MGNRHDRAVKQLAKRYKYGTKSEIVFAHRISGYPDPEVRVGSEDFVPDIYVEFKNGREKLIEVDTKPRSAKGERQHEAFQRSADVKPNVRSYENHFASEIL